MPRYSGFLLSCCPFRHDAEAGARYVAILVKCQQGVTPKRERSSALTGLVAVTSKDRGLKIQVVMWLLSTR
jgi:hypothetical protein